MDVRALHRAAKSHYWDEKDLATARRLLEAGIELARTQELHDLEKAMNDDLASFCWPGWNEPGITIHVDDSRAGEAAAEENLRLAEILQKEDGPTAKAWWLVGAYRMTDGDLDGALDAFERQRTLAGEDPAHRLLAEAYMEATRTLRGDDGTDHLAAFARLETEGGEQGEEFAQQVLTAFAIALRRMNDPE